MIHIHTLHSFAARTGKLLQSFVFLNEAFEGFSWIAECPECSCQCGSSNIIPHNADCVKCVSIKMFLSNYEDKPADLIKMWSLTRVDPIKRFQPRLNTQTSFSGVFDLCSSWSWTEGHKTA